MLTIEQAREILRLDTADNDAIIEGLLSSIPDYIELTTGVTAEQQAGQPLADTAGKLYSCSGTMRNAPTRKSYRGRLTAC